MLSGVAAAIALWKDVNLLAAILGGVCLGLLVPALYYFFKLRGIYSVLGGSQFQGSRDSVLVEEDLPRDLPKPHTHEAHHLVGPEAGSDTLSVNWITFLKGCEALTSWVSHPRVSPVLYVGINPAGIIIASYIRGRLRHDVPLATYLIPPGGTRDSTEDHLHGVPASFKGKVVPVLMVDSQIKTGTTAGAVAKRSQGTSAMVSSSGMSPWLPVESLVKGG